MLRSAPTVATGAGRTAGRGTAGSVRVRGGSLQVRVLAGVDPVTRRDRYLSETVKGTDRPARREAEKVMARLQAEVDGQRSAQRSVTFGYTLEPMAASTVRQVHAVISGALSAAVRWDWIAANPARGAPRPRQTPPQPDPPSPADGAFATDDDWGTLV